MMFLTQVLLGYVSNMNIFFDMYFLSVKSSLGFFFLPIKYGIINENYVGRHILSKI